MSAVRQEGRTVFVRLADVPLRTRLLAAARLRDRELKGASASDALAVLERGIEYERAARFPSERVGLWVTAEEAERVLRP